MCQLFCEVDRIKFLEFINLTTFSYASVFWNKSTWYWLKTHVHRQLCPNTYIDSIVLATALWTEINCVWCTPGGDLLLCFNYASWINFYSSPNSKLLLRNKWDFTISRVPASSQGCVCDACLCLPFISIPFLIKAIVAKTFIVLILFSLILAYSWCLAFVCILLVLTVSSYFVKFYLREFSEARVRLGSPGEELPVLLPGDWRRSWLPRTTWKLSSPLEFFDASISSGHKLV